LVVEQIELRPHQIQKIRLYMTDHGRLIRATGLTLTTKRRSALARAYAGGNTELMKTKIRERLSQLTAEQKEALRRIACEDNRYCDNKRNYQIVTIIVQSIWALIEPISGLVAMIVFMLNFRMFDDICECQ
jgi:hypothetical protein